MLDQHVSQRNIYWKAAVHPCSVFLSGSLFLFVGRKMPVCGFSPQRKTSPDIRNLESCEETPKRKKNTKKGPPGQLAKTLKTALYLQFSGMNLKLATISWTMQHSSSSKLFFIVFQPYRRRSVFCMNAATACFELSHLIFSLPASSTLLSY